MAEYIEREAVQKILRKYTEGMTENIPIYPEKVRLASMDLDAIPAADVVEVKHGRWTLHNDGSGTCDQCGFTQKNVWDYDNWQSYCGVCGADMRERKGG